jgi:peptide/nickel transport system permease protein
MNQIPSTENSNMQSLPKTNELRRISRIILRQWAVVIGLVVIVLFLFISIFGPLIAPYDQYEQNLSITLQQPSSAHPLGTDGYGRDTLSRMIYGTRISLMVGVVAVTIAGVIGILLGLVAGYFGAWIGNIIMRLVDTLMVLPPIALMLAIAAVLGGGLVNVMISIGIGMIPTYSRLMYGQVLTIKVSDYIIAARVIGASDWRIMVRHLLPNSFPVLLVLVSLNMGMAILMEASLSFLGIGISPPQAAWGSMINDGYRYLLTDPILSLAPGIAIMLVALSFNLVGDGLRDALDPRLRGTI